MPSLFFTVGWPGWGWAVCVSENVATWLSPEMKCAPLRSQRDGRGFTAAAPTESVRGICVLRPPQAVFFGAVRYSFDVATSFLGSGCAPGC